MRHDLLTLHRLRRKAKYTLHRGFNQKSRMATDSVPHGRSLLLQRDGAKRRPQTSQVMR